MKITITHDFETLAEAEEFLDRLTGGRQVISAEHQAPMVIIDAAALGGDVDGNLRPGPVKRAKRERKPKAVETQPLPLPTVEAAVVPLSGLEAKIEAAELQAATDALFKAKGLPACIELLARYGVAKVRELVPAQYAKYVAEAGELAK